jgi:hypothetical protein
MDDDNVELLPAAREMLAALWTRAMNNDPTLHEIKAIRVGCVVAIAITKHGVKGVGPIGAKIILDSARISTILGVDAKHSIAPYRRISGVSGPSAT